MSLFFALGIAFVFAALALAEGNARDYRARLVQTGLLRWMTSRNWPAKVGAGLLVLGIGALLRYLLINLDVPPELKLASGLLIAAVLAAASYQLRDRPQWSGIHIALAGAAAGVSYLTAYSAYGFFGYMTDLNALSLLVLVSVSTAVFAVRANAMSVAVLAMLGAFLAPAFALESAGPLEVYGYYCVISGLCLVMISLRGWRSLIHLSFLFTLAGSLFFAWTAQFHQAEHYAAMQPMLVILAAIHVAMPLLEQKHVPSGMTSKFDLAYFVSLPIVSAVLLLLIAPTLHMQGAAGLAFLSVAWALPAGILVALGRAEAARHGVVAALLLLCALFLRFEDAPWSLIGLGVVVAALAGVRRWGSSRKAEELLCGGALLFGLLSISHALLESVPDAVFLTPFFAKRLVCAVLLAIAAALVRNRSRGMSGVLAAVAGVWLALSTVSELVRLDWIGLPQLVFAALLTALAMAALARHWRDVSGSLAVTLVLAISLTGWWAAHHASMTFALSCLVLAPVILIAWILSAGTSSTRDDSSADTVAFALLPVSLMPWANAVFAGDGSRPLFMLGALSAMAALAGLALARALRRGTVTYEGLVLPLHFLALTTGLVCVTLAHIERSVPAMLFELSALAYLLVVAVLRNADGHLRSPVYGATAVVAVVLVLQAMLLRVLGQDRVMSLEDLLHMQMPIVVSLLWATLGGGLAWLGANRSSRTAWTLGASLLVVSAMKSVFLDFGSLGELANILALIASGLVFLFVAFLAPFPQRPNAPEPPPTAKRPPPIPKWPKPAPANGVPSEEPAAGRAQANGSPRNASATPSPAMEQARTDGSRQTNRAVFDVPEVSEAELQQEREAQMWRAHQSHG